MQSKSGPVLIGFAYIGLLVFMMVFSAEQSKNFDEFAKYWGLFGPIIGVATGAMPTFFFKAQADKAESRAEKAEEVAVDASTRAEAYAAVAEPEAAESVAMAAQAEQGADTDN